MIIKKFVAKTEADATEDARRELGQGIVIMNVRPVKQKGFFAFLLPPRVEVTVALEDEPDDVPIGKTPMQTLRPQQNQRPGANVDLTAGEKLVRATQDGTLPPLGSRVSPVNPVSSARQMPPQDIQGQPQSAGRQAVQRPDRSSREHPKDLNLPTEGRPEQNARPSENAARRSGSGDVGVLEEKLDSLHNLLEERIGGSSTARDKKADNSRDEDDTSVNGEMLTFVKLLYNTLISNDVDEIYANQLTDEIEKMNKPNMPLEYVLANVYQKMVLKFGKSEPITPAQAGPKALFFIGPTGVGKTTTIAKIASELFVMQHKKVALLTVDTYRIAAAEQLKTYASIMEIPCRVIYSVDEMRTAAENFRDYDFLCIDTAGHSMHNEEQRKNTDAFLHAFDGVIESDVFLVLSATTKYRDLTDITDSYSAMTQYRLLFTKMDETSAAGNLYNIKLRTGAPMSYITNGQNVPDDIAVFDAQSVVKGLLGGKKQNG
ncbi:MAG: flagellar biosynthesis protein FlhF [Lachnospiraceae bacterium]|nr:flagellar biosynthesis protein FlhF [Lachnospiraceae bacterium]